MIKAKNYSNCQTGGLIAATVQCELLPLQLLLLLHSSSGLIDSHSGCGN